MLRSFTKLGVPPDPADVGLQRFGELIGARLEACRIIEKDKIQSAQRLRRCAVFRTSADDWREALIQRSCILNFLERLVGGNGVGRDHEHNRVGADDQRLEAFPPVLEGINLLAVDQGLEAARLECRFEPIRKGHVLARIRDKNSGFRLNVRRSFRNHRSRVPSRREMLPNFAGA